MELLKTVISSIFLIQNKIDSIDLNAIIGNFVNPDEFKSNFFTTPIEEPKFYHRVNTTMSHLVIQYKIFIGCTLKVTFKFTFFLKFEMSDLNLLFFFIKYQLEELKERIVQN